MKDKNVAGILALFLGWVGIHRFYLGQAGLGILYIFLMFSGISFVLGLIDAVAFFVMDQDNFDLKYNRKHFEVVRKGDTDFNRNRERRKETSDRRQERHASERYRRRNAPQAAPVERHTYRKPNPHKQNGIQKYKDYDYRGAINDFQKALEIDETDVAVHFNLACAYSLEEEARKAFFHLDKAVGYGFKDFERIKQHDALAFLRIQEDFDVFEANGFRLAPPAQAEEAPREDDLLASAPDLLDQLKKLDELRQKGLLTEEEFVEQKKRLMD